jgi:hypothetical protein
VKQEFSSLPHILESGIIAIGLLTACSGFATPSQSLPLRATHDVPLPGGTTRFDYESFDPKTGLLFIAHVGDSQVLVFNTRPQKLAADIPGAEQKNDSPASKLCL